MAGVRQVKAGGYNAFRPWTLHGAIVPVLLGGAMAYGAGSEEWILFILALAGGVLLQSAANLLNTYGDYRAGLDTVENHSRAPELVSGTLRPKDVKIAGLACLAVTALCYGGFGSTITPITADLFGAAHVTENYGVMYLAFGFAGLAGPQIAVTLSAGGDYSMAFLAACVISAVAFAMALIVRKKVRAIAA